MIQATGGTPRIPICQAPPSPLPGVEVTEASAAPQPAPVDSGPDRNVGEHAGTIGYVLATVMSTLADIASSPRFAREIPGLNLGVAVVESANALHKHADGKPVEAMGHLGNAASCFSSFAEDVGRAVSIAAPASYPMLGSAAVGLGIAGGLLGLAQGTQEIKNGLALTRANGSARLLHIGIADTISGVTTVAGIGLRSAGCAPALGTGLLVTATVCDLLSIAVDYAGTLAERKRDAQGPSAH